MPTIRGRANRGARPCSAGARDIDALYSGAPPPQLTGLAQAVKNFALEREDFLAVIDGMEMDVVADIRAPDLTTLDLYCDRVACAVGRLSVRVFGMEREAGLALAHHLGRALQLTNILRDLDEDAAMGRLYLPREALRGVGIISTDPAAVLANPALAEACAILVAAGARALSPGRAPSWRERRARIVRAPRIMGEAYRIILEHLVARGFAPPRDAGSTAARASFSLIVLRNLCAMPADRPHCRRRPCRTVRRAEAFRARRACRSCTRPRAFAGGRCRSYHDATLGMTIDNGNHLLLSGNHAALDYLAASARGRLVGPPTAEFAFVDLGHRRTLDVAHQ